MGELYNPFPKLPKNIRQIGERDQMVRLYIEDYVNTYLKRLYPAGGQDLRAGLLLGSAEEHEGVPFIFVDGALEMDGVTREGENVEFTEEAWKRAYQSIEDKFPKRTIQGWFLCGVPGCTLSPLNYWKQHTQYFNGKNQIMYLNGGLEGDEAIYITSRDGFYKLEGHYIYYERNQMMQDYMISRKDNKRIETGESDPVIRDFRQKMEEKKNQTASRKNTVNVLGGLCSALAVLVLAGGTAMFNNYEKMREMETVIASVLPEGYEGWESAKNQGIKETPKREDDFNIEIEQVAGNVFPTEDSAEEALPVQGDGMQKVSIQEGVEQETGIQKDSVQKVSIQEGVEQETAIQKDAIQEIGDQKGITGEAAQDQAAKTSKAESQETGADSVQTSVKPLEAPGEGQMYYAVQDGETLYSICFKLYQSVNSLEDICTWNGLENQDKITAGQKLIVPKTAVPETTGEEKAAETAAETTAP